VEDFIKTTGIRDFNIHTTYALEKIQRHRSIDSHQNVLVIRLSLSRNTNYKIILNIVFKNDQQIKA
jgi:hypothetical protein